MAKSKNETTKRNKNNSNIKGSLRLQEEQFLKNSKNENYLRKRNIINEPQFERFAFNQNSHIRIPYQNDFHEKSLEMNNSYEMTNYIMEASKSLRAEKNHKNGTFNSSTFGLGSLETKKSLMARDDAYDQIEFYKSYGKELTLKRNDNKNNVTVERYIPKFMQESLSKKSGMIPILKTHKSYDISFTLNSKFSTESDKNTLKKTKNNHLELIEYLDKIPKNKREDQSNYVNKSCLNRKESVTLTSNLSKKKSDFSNIPFVTISHGDEGNAKTEVLINTNNLDNIDASYTNDYKRRYEPIKSNTNDCKDEKFYGINDSNYYQSYEKTNTGNFDKNENTFEIKKIENSELLRKPKEWVGISHSFYQQGKIGTQREINEGDIKYFDTENNILKLEVASWKSGEEYIKSNNKFKKIKYEWRLDPTSNCWIKYNSDTNKILYKGDWKSGSEWIRNSKGKFEERHYKYIKNENNQWIKLDQKISDFSTSIGNFYEWVPNKKKKCTSLNHRKWEKRHYRYEQNNKGLWEKVDQKTMKKINKPTKHGWKKGIDFHMDENGKIKRVNYVWDIKDNGEMMKIIEKSKEPINSTWKEGTEIIRKNDIINKINFAWVQIGKNKWIKIDQETGSPISKKIKTNRISKNFHFQFNTEKK